MLSATQGHSAASGTYVARCRPDFLGPSAVSVSSVGRDRQPRWQQGQNGHIHVCLAASTSEPQLYARETDALPHITPVHEQLRLEEQRRRLSASVTSPEVPPLPAGQVFVPSSRRSGVGLARRPAARFRHRPADGVAKMVTSPLQQHMSASSQAGQPAIEPRLQHMPSSIDEEERHTGPTKQEEVELCLAIQDLQKIEDARRDIFQSGPAGSRSSADPAAQMQRWQAAVQAGSMQALQKRVNKGQQALAVLKRLDHGLILKAAYRQRRLGCDMEVEELVPIGEQALHRAALGFDPAAGTRFSTYVYPSIVRALWRACHQEGQILSMPARMGELQWRIKRGADDLETRLNRAPTPQELSAHLGLSLATLASAAAAARVPVGLDVVSQRDGEGTYSLLDTVGDPSQKDPDEEFLQAEVNRDAQRQVEAALDQLSLQEAEVVALRYGIFDQKQRTLAEVAKAMGRSVQWASMQEKTALHKLRQIAQRQGIRPDRTNGITSLA